MARSLRAAGTRPGQILHNAYGYGLFTDPEIIAPVTGQPLPDGQIGELVFTSLTKQAMPIIRYRTGDLTRLLPGTARTMRRIEKITGRTDDMIIVRGVNVFPTQIEELLLQESCLAPHFQCILGKDGPLDTSPSPPNLPPANRPTRPRPPPTTSPSGSRATSGSRSRSRSSRPAPSNDRPARCAA
jgi:phenylacetate-coenzyme A ligase PaaK-like adenylate-forming protein